MSEDLYPGCVDENKQKPDGKLKYIETNYNSLKSRLLSHAIGDLDYVLESPQICCCLGKRDEGAPYNCWGEDCYKTPFKTERHVCFTSKIITKQIYNHLFGVSPEAFRVSFVGTEYYLTDRLCLKLREKDLPQFEGLGSVSEIIGCSVFVVALYKPTDIVDLFLGQ